MKTKKQVKSRKIAPVTTLAVSFPNREARIAEAEKRGVPELQVYMEACQKFGREPAASALARWEKHQEANPNPTHQRITPTQATDLGKVLAARQAELTSGEAIAVLARSVAHAAFGDALLTPQPQNRNEMFERVQKGVKEGIKKLGIGFHASK
jgi:hypothetical protein